MSDYVNIHGDPVSTIAPPPAKRPKREKPAAWHNGWRVIGIPPGALEDAREGNARVAAMAEKAGGKVIAPFDEGNS